MLISVVITNYNYARFLPEAIELVLRQTYRAVECIVVDDGFTDNSRSVIETYPSVKAIFKENSGQASALRAGVAVAKGDVIVSLDADDYLFPFACDRIAAAWRPGAACLNFRLAVDRKDSPCLPKEFFLGSDHTKYLLKYGYYPSAPMSGNAFDAVYVRFLLDNAVNLDGDGVDAYLLYCAPVFGRVDHIDERLGFYRTHGGNISMSSGRLTVKNIGDHVYYQYWAQQNAQKFALERGMDVSKCSYLKGAYSSLWLIFARDGYYRRRALPEQSRIVTVMEGIKAFIFQPRISPLRRMKNIAVLAALLILPLPFRRALAKRVISYA